MIRKKGNGDKYLSLLLILLVYLLLTFGLSASSTERTIAQDAEGMRQAAAEMLLNE